MQDPFAKYRQPPASAQPAPLPMQPQPFPGAKPIVLKRPDSKVLQDDLAINRDVRDANADARAEEAARLARERAELDKQRAEIEARSAELRGGVDRTAQENTAAGHMQTLQVNLDLINQAVAKDPKAFAPGLGEALLGDKLGEQFRGFTTSPNRKVVYDSYGPVLESAIYLATGAAANDPQVERLAAGLVPVYTDSLPGGEEALKAKAIRLEAELAKAASLSGPAREQAMQAIAEVRKLYPLMFGVDAQDVMNPLIRPQENVEQVALSGSSERTPIPPEMQAEFNDFLRRNPPGSLTTEKFLDFYVPLFSKYDFGGPENMNQLAKQYVDSYNAGKANTTIPSPSKQLEGIEAAMATAGADKGLLGDLYTGTASAANAFSFGAPELLAGRENRAAFNQAREENPVAAGIGEVAGSIAPVIGVTKAASIPLRELIENPVTRNIMEEVAGNAIYGGLRGAAGAEPENRLEQGAYGAALGGGAAVAARGLIDGAPGFLGLDKQRAIGQLGEQTFAIPPGRGALPADEITPPRYQGMSDDELRQEVARIGQQLDGQAAQAQIVSQNQAARQQIQQEAEKVAAGNRNRQEQYVRENFRSTNPGQIDQIRADAEQMFPTDVGVLLQQPVFANRLAAIKDPSTEGMEAIGILEARRDRLNNYLAQDGTERTGTIPAVDLTTPQRMGAGEAEEALQGLPFVHGQREAANISFNRQNSSRVLARVGKELPKDIEPGTQMNAYVNKQLNEVYDQLRPAIKGKIDQPFNNAIAALRREALKTREGESLWADIESTIAAFRRPDGSFDGTGYRELSTKLRRYSEVWGNNNNPNTTVPMQDMARVAEQVRKQAQALVNRSNPAVGRRLKAVEGAWAHQMRIEAASIGPAKAAGGVYSPDEYLNAIQKLDTSRGKSAVARGRAMDQEYAQSARKILGGKPAKKTSLRETAITGYVLAQAGPLSAAALSAALAGYVPGVKRVVQAIVDGKLGKTPAAVEQALGSSAAGKRLLEAIGPEGRKMLLTQLLRDQATDKEQ